MHWTGRQPGGGCSSRWARVGDWRSELRQRGPDGAAVRAACRQLRSQRLAGRRDGGGGSGGRAGGGDWDHGVTEWRDVARRGSSGGGSGQLCLPAGATPLWGIGLRV